jgi:hypothetical protein
MKRLMEDKKRGQDMVEIIDLRGLEEKDVRLLESLAQSLREKAQKKKSEVTEDGFTKSAGSWKGLIDADKLITDIYASRLVSTRPEVKL